MPSRTQAQVPAGGEVTRGVTRAQLTTSADSLERAALRADGGERTRLMNAASAIRQRLAEGDFQVGDRLVIVVRGQQALTDTFTVRQDRTVAIPELPALSLAGVLHSEAQSRVSAHITKYVKEADVSVTPLVRIGVIGLVARPGFYSVPADALLSDVMMEAGGPAATADLRKTTIRRGTATYQDAKSFADQLSRGSTIAAIGVRSGDEIVVPEAQQRRMTETVQIVLGVVTAAAMIFTLARQ